ncbi:hypothetical protein [Mastigocoleus testarum]|uniref:Minimal CRISPR polymerase domain-containing protein n=1 Tax=Mastigocoleus testarum BC008 TaxID=371196 RepID=A0A0V7ZSX6_9CYAN|nr:hypothetical protein [Mastigocoleus testarum]KST67489.1 hypothetical protein BC008_30305 [Mastigocoleus testarum BC008]
MIYNEEVVEKTKEEIFKIIAKARLPSSACIALDGDKVGTKFGEFYRKTASEEATDLSTNLKSFMLALCDLNTKIGSSFGDVVKFEVAGGDNILIKYSLKEIDGEILAKKIANLFERTIGIKMSYGLGKTAFLAHCRLRQTKSEVN